MQDNFSTASNHRTMPLGCIDNDPSRLLTVSEFWREWDEPIEWLSDPLATFAEDTEQLLRLCQAEGITYRPATANQPAAFPLQTLTEFYPANP